VENNKHYCDSMREKTYGTDEKSYETDEKSYRRIGALYTALSGSFGSITALNFIEFLGNYKFNPTVAGNAAIFSVIGAGATIVTFAAAARYFMKEATDTIKKQIRP